MSHRDARATIALRVIEIGPFMTAAFVPLQTWLGAPFGQPGRNCKAAVVGIPFDCGPIPTGSARAWDVDPGESAHLRRYDPCNNIDVLDRLDLVDCGDVPVPITSSSSEPEIRRRGTIAQVGDRLYRSVGIGPR
jgi:hypothetical protein